MFHLAKNAFDTKCRCINESNSYAMANERSTGNFLRIRRSDFRIWENFALLSYKKEITAGAAGKLNHLPRSDAGVRAESEGSRMVCDLLKQAEPNLRRWM